MRLLFHLSRRAFETQMTQMEADFVEREAPPSYGQLIAQGLIPPVEDFPVYNPAQVVATLHTLDTLDRNIDCPLLLTLATDAALLFVLYTCSHIFYNEK